MMNVLISENLKYRRTFAKRLILAVPLFFILVALPQKLFMPADYMRPWQLLIAQVFNMWPVIFLPLGMALFAALVAAQEKKAGGYRSLCAHDVQPGAVWTGKVCVMGYYSLLAALVLAGATLVAGLVTAGGGIPLAQILSGALVCWLASLALIPLQLWMATWKGPLFSMALGFVGMIAGMIAAPTPFWVCVPWSWPARLMCPIIGVHPNGVPLQAGDALLNPSVIPVGIIVSIAAFALALTLTALWFSKREVR